MNRRTIRNLTLMTVHARYLGRSAAGRHGHANCHQDIESFRSWILTVTDSSPAFALFNQRAVTTLSLSVEVPGTVSEQLPSS